MTLFVDTFPSPAAEVVVAVDERGAVKALYFVGRRSREEILAALRRGGPLREDAERCARVRAEVQEYFAGARTEFDVEVAGNGTDFQREVWRALRAIPYGETTTYGELARDLGRPKASRAVGRANGTNPISLIVPCHRVVGADGTLTGYAGGIELKRTLLDFERGQLTFAP